MTARAFQIVDYPQRSPEWFHARVGRLTGSRAAAMLSSIKSGEAAGRRNLRVELVCERLTTLDQSPDFHSRDMERGQERESDAIALFEGATGELVQFAGFLSSTEHMAGCSPDGYLGDFDAIVEAKCPKAATHLEYLDRGAVPPKYLPQLRHNVWISGAEAAYFVSYSPDFPESLALSVVRIERDQLDIDEYEAAALQFLSEVDEEFERVAAMSNARCSS